MPMLYQDSEKFAKNVKINMAGERLNPVSQKGRPELFSLSWINRFSLRLNISKKISYGYSLAIGIAVLGTTIGLIIGDYYQRKATEELRLSDEKHHLLNDLKNTVSDVRLHPQRLVTVLEKPILFKYETAKFIGEVSLVNTNLTRLESFINEHHSNSSLAPTELNKLLDDYKNNVEAYTQLVKAIWEQIDPISLTPESIPAAEQQILALIRGEAAIQIGVKFERLAESLNRLISISETQQQQASDRRDRAEVLRRQIIIASMVLSATIAIALAVYTSRAIARPLEAVTQVARAITKEANFNLLAPVTTEDEVGLLATSLNQLVQWVGEYTEQLELARQTLELRVEDRTQELTTALQELKHTQSQLIQTEKMSSLGQLVAGVAHEINNPVNFIYGNLTYAEHYMQNLLQLVQLYQQQYPESNPLIQTEIEALDLDFLKEDLPKILSSMKMGVERIRAIVLSLRNFSRLDESEMKAVDIHEGIDNTLLILNNRIKKGIEVIKQYGNLPLVTCFPAQLNQVFMNIVANAIDVLEERIGKKAELSGSLERQPFPNPAIAIETRQLDSERIQVAIRDNGSGIPPEIKNKLFDPFFTTKEVGKGTGLGLSICYQIIEKHQGKIEVNSQVGQGTEFIITVPIKTSKTIIK